MKLKGNEEWLIKDDELDKLSNESKNFLQHQDFEKDELNLLN
jgi:hypothetical protein